MRATWRALLVACAAAATFPCLPAAAQASSGEIGFLLSPDGLRQVGEPPDLSSVRWAPGTGRDLVLRVRNEAGSPAAVTFRISDLRQRAGLGDALRMSDGARNWTLADAQLANRELLTVPSGGSERATMRLELPAETGDEVQGGSASFTIRLTATWNGRAERVDLPVGAPAVADGSYSGLATTGRDLLSWLSIGLSLLVTGAALRQRSRAHSRASVTRRS